MVYSNVWILGQRLGFDVGYNVLLFSILVLDAVIFSLITIITIIMVDCFFCARS